VHPCNLRLDSRMPCPSKSTSRIVQCTVADGLPCQVPLVVYGINYQYECSKGIKTVVLTLSRLSKLTLSQTSDTQNNEYVKSSLSPKYPKSSEERPASAITNAMHQMVRGLTATRYSPHICFDRTLPIMMGRLLSSMKYRNFKLGITASK
jgi:hypothetical protein